MADVELDAPLDYVALNTTPGADAAQSSATKQRNKVKMIVLIALGVCVVGGVVAAIAVETTKGGSSSSSSSPSSSSSSSGAAVPVTDTSTSDERYQSIPAPRIMCNSNSTTLCTAVVAKHVNCILGQLVSVSCTQAEAIQKEVEEQGCDLYDENFKITSSPIDKCPPRFHGFQIARAAFKANRAGSDGLETAQTCNAQGECFPNSQCSLRLGEEYGWEDAGELGAIELTAKTMAARMLKPATFNPSAACKGGGLPNCCTCADADCTVFNDSECKKVGASNVLVDDNGNAVDEYVYNVHSASDQYLKNKHGTSAARVPRGMHGKGQACTPSTFKIEDDLSEVPEALRVGLLAKAGQSFDALIRWGGNKNITLKDVHDVRIKAFSVKVFGVTNKYERVKIANIPSYDQPADAQKLFEKFNFTSPQEDNTVDFLHVAIRGPDNNDATLPPYNLFVQPGAKSYYNTFILGGGAASNLGIKDLTPVHMNPLRYTYGSASTLRLGNHGAMRMHWLACPGQLEGVEDFTKDYSDPDYMKRNLKAVLAAGEFKMCGYIQIQENPCVQSVENATQRWLTKPIHVFTVTIPQHELVDYDHWCDNTVFHPFRTVKQHVPIGSINRVRTAVYAYSHNYRLMINNGVNYRHDQNGEMTVDTGTNTCPFGSRRPQGFIPNMVVPTNEFNLGVAGVGQDGPPPPPSTTQSQFQTVNGGSFTNNNH